MCKLALINKRWQKLCNYDKLWRFLYYNKFGKVKEETRDWKSLYMQRVLNMSEDEIAEQESFQFMRGLFDERDFILKSNKQKLPEYYIQSLKDQEELQIQLAIELSKKETIKKQQQKEMEDNLLKEEISYEIEFEEDPDQEEQVEEEEDLSDTYSGTCTSVEVTPIEPKQTFAFASNKNMYE